MSDSNTILSIEFISFICKLAERCSKLGGLTEKNRILTTTRM